MDIDDLDAGRLCNLAYSALVNDGGPNREQTRETLDSMLNRAAKPPKGKPKTNGQRKRGGMTADKAKRMAADLESYDGRIRGGRLVGEG